MSEIALYPLEGTNPLGVLAALGTFRSCALSWADVRLRWECSEIVPYAVLVFNGAVEPDDVIELIDNQRSAWRGSSLLANSHSDVKEVQLGDWAKAIRDDKSGMPVDEVFVALVSEGAQVWKKDKSGSRKVNKPSHLHFTAGQQQFLDVVREVLNASDAERLREAIFGPWRFDAKKKTLRWDPRSERIYAVRGFKPSDDPSLNVPAADWLGFVGLSFFPTRNRNGSLETNACNRGWKVSAMRWPLWPSPLRLAETRQLLLSDLLVQRVPGRPLRPSELLPFGVNSVVEAPIRRAEAGGRGNFGAASIVCQIATV